MALVDEMNAAIADAMRKHDSVRLGTLRMLKAALMNREIERGHALDERGVAPGRQHARQAAEGLDRTVHQRRSPGSGRQGIGRDRACSKPICRPRPTRPSSRRRSTDAIAETGATSPKDMGRVMKAAMAKLAGQTVDGKIVNELVRKKLAAAKLFFESGRLTL